MTGNKDFLTDYQDIDRGFVAFGGSARGGNGYKWQSQAPRYHGGAPTQTRSERVLKQPIEPPLSEGNTSGSGEGKMEHKFELTANVPITLHDSPLPGGYTPGSDEGRLTLQELMTMCTKLSKQVLDLEKEKDVQALEILRLNKRLEAKEESTKAFELIKFIKSMLEEYKRWCCSLIPAESDSLPHAHTQATKTYYKHQDSRIKKAQELNTKTSANSDIQDLP
ncbi:hypothetical protein Tco_0630644 [Tanacetum coccineum]